MVQKVIVQNPISLNMEASEIHAAERDVMTLARVYECIAIIDDGIAGEIGEMCNVDVHGTFYLIFQAMWRGSLSKQKAI